MTAPIEVLELGRRQILVEIEARVRRLVFVPDCLRDLSLPHRRCPERAP